MSAEQLNSHLFVMHVGGWRVVLHAPPPRLDDKPGAWHLDIETNRVCVDAVLWQGEEKSFVFGDLGPTQVVAALELLAGNNAPDRRDRRGSLLKDTEAMLWCDSLHRRDTLRRSAQVSRPDVH